MTTFLLRVGELFVWVLIVDGLIAGFLALTYTAERLWPRLRSNVAEFADLAEWEAELTRSAREAAMRRHPAGGGR